MNISCPRRGNQLFTQETLVPFIRKGNSQPYLSYLIANTTFLTSQYSSFHSFWVVFISWWLAFWDLLHLFHLNIHFSSSLFPLFCQISVQFPSASFQHGLCFRRKLCLVNFIGSRLLQVLSFYMKFPWTLPLLEQKKKQTKKSPVRCQVLFPDSLVMFFSKHVLSIVSISYAYYHQISYCLPLLFPSQTLIPCRYCSFLVFCSHFFGI